MFGRKSKKIKELRARVWKQINKIWVLEEHVKDLLEVMDYEEFDEESLLSLAAGVFGVNTIIDSVKNERKILSYVSREHIVIIGEDFYVEFEK